MRVLVAMSGGVDSSVAAARMVDQGHEVVGVHLALSRSSSSSNSPGRGSRGCCTLDDARDARRVADMLGIPFYVWDLSERFAADVVADFIDEYRHGRTPNPCLRCNEKIKFAAVLERALALDYEAVATGHYAQVIDGPHGPELHRAVDSTKDQSYVLGVLNQHQLRHALFPLGSDVKEAVRAEAEQRGLLVARKPDSHDICFIPDGDTAAFLARSLGERPGDIVDSQTGDVIAHHDGTYAYTIGQRRGLNLRTPAADGTPRYVVDVDVDHATIVVGPASLLDVDAIEAVRPIWAGEALGPDPVDVQAQVRAHGQPVPARAHVSADRLVVDLLTPVRGLAPGQAVVLYDGTRVVGSGTVDRTRRVVRT
jgi:tRNA-specific 2-thiouridylase